MVVYVPSTQGAETRIVSSRLTLNYMKLHEGGLFQKANVFSEQKIIYILKVYSNLSGFVFKIM